MDTNGANRREVSCCFLIDSQKNFLLQQRDDIPGILQPGKIGTFGGHREDGESSVACIVREIREETGLSLAPDRFKSLVIYDGADIDGPASRLVAEFFVVDNVTTENLVISEGSLIVVAENQLGSQNGKLTPLTEFALTKLLELRRCRA